MFARNNARTEGLTLSFDLQYSKFYPNKQPLYQFKKNVIKPFVLRLFFSRRLSFWIIYVQSTNVRIGAEFRSEMVRETVLMNQGMKIEQKHSRNPEKVQNF